MPDTQFLPTAKVIFTGRVIIHRLLFIVIILNCVCLDFSSGSGGKSSSGPIVVIVAVVVLLVVVGYFVMQNQS